jgi:hypothetical protein
VAKGRYTSFMRQDSVWCPPIPDLRDLIWLADFLPVLSKCCPPIFTA